MSILNARHPRTNSMQRGWPKFGETTPTDSRRGLEHVKAQPVTREHVIKHGKLTFDDWLRTVLVATSCRVSTVKFSYSNSL